MKGAEISCTDAYLFANSVFVFDLHPVLWSYATWKQGFVFLVGRNAVRSVGAMLSFLQQSHHHPQTFIHKGHSSVNGKD
jgi:hypothetical protein